ATLRLIMESKRISSSPGRSAGRAPTSFLAVTSITLNNEAPGDALSILRAMGVHPVGGIQRLIGHEQRQHRGDVIHVGATPDAHPLQGRSDLRMETDLLTRHAVPPLGGARRASMVPGACPPCGLRMARRGVGVKAGTRRTTTLVPPLPRRCLRPD